ncbi:MAG TPA: SRPBCC family protein [Streptosporangiaceae bacterium]|jgi:uncharacterized protein YndB with AHSA1/START domain
MTDVVHEISATRRVSGTRVLAAGEARTVTISRTYDTTLENLWEACTEPERIRRWFVPVTLDGDRYAIEGNASGTIQQCDPPQGFAATWEFGGEVSWIEVRLTPAERGTRFELEHIAHVDDQRWAQFGPGAVGVGWDLMVLGLSLHLSGTMMASRMEWPASAEGREFSTLSSAAWRDASIAAGTDPGAARAAAVRTTAFYTGS